MANKSNFREKNTKKEKGAFKAHKERTEYQISRDAEKKHKRRKPRHDNQQD